MANIYSWESFIRIHGGDPGARDVFEKLMDALLRAENPDKEVHIVKASRGDGGIDVYVHHEDGIDIYQCKFFMGTLNSSRWSQIKKSFKKAMEQPKGVKVLRWYLCMPREMQKEDIEEWDTFKKEKESPDVKLRYIDGNEIISRIEECDRLNNTVLLEKYFHENRKRLFTNKDLIIPFTLSKANGAQGGTYVPRDDLLEKIEKIFSAERIVFLSGVGGCGKSELARAYGYKHQDDYDEIFWLTCDEGTTPDFMRLMEKADLCYKIEKSEMKDFSNKVLIIVDNCNIEVPSFLGELENWTGKAKILVTTRLSCIGDYESVISLEESSELESFAFKVFEKNYCKKPRWGKAKTIQEEEKDSIHTICQTVQYNTMIVSLTGIWLREYSNLSISECAKKIHRGISEIPGKIKYAKDQETRSEEMRDILRFLFSDILIYPFSPEQKAVLTVLSLTSAAWYSIDFISHLLGDMSNEYAVGQLLDFGWLQGNGDRMTMHPLIAEVIADQPIIIRKPSFFEIVLENYLGLPDEYLGMEQFLINKVLNKASDASPETKIAVMLMINHGGYRKLFIETHPDVSAAYFVYVNYKKKRFFEYQDLGKNETYLLTEVSCQNYKDEQVVLLKLYNTEASYRLDLNVAFHEMWIHEIPEGFSQLDSFLLECHISKYLTRICKDAFSGCSGLSGKLHFPESLTSIEEGAFQNCSSLSGELHLPENLTNLGKNAFSGCSGLRGNLHLPKSLTIIGEGAFQSCSGLRGELHLPKNLTNIGKNAFSGCSGLKGNLHLPKSLTSIGEGAFQSCSGLRGGLHLPESLMNIGYSAFFDCFGLNGVLHLPRSLSSIGNETFCGCSGLRGELHLPENLTSIGCNAFNGCSGLRGELHLPESLKNIGAFAFSGCSGLRGELHLPKSLTSIENGAFESCSGLCGELHLPENLTSIGEGAFAYCSRLSGELHLPEGLTTIGKSAFKGCSGLRGELQLPKSLTSIGDKAFYGCSGISFAEELTKAFEGCNGLNVKLDIPVSSWAVGVYDFSTYCGIDLQEGVTSIGDSAFEDSIIWGGEVYLPEGLTSIGDKAFKGCIGLSGLHLPKSLSSIGNSAFEGCSGLSGELHLPEGLTTIGRSAFEGCSGLSGELHLPESLTSIGVFAFLWCSGLNGELHLPKSLANISNCAFAGCDGLSGELHLPESLMSIGSQAFYGCKSLSGELHLPKNLMSIGDQAFYGCSGLSGELYLPESLKNIGAFAFSGCSGLSGELNLPKSLTSIENGAFKSCSGLSGELHLPESLMNIGANAFYGCSGLSGELYLPESLKNIGAFAFEGCSGLNGKLRLLEGLTSIGDKAFYGCSGLSGELHLPEGLTSIGDDAFHGCSGLSGELHLPESLTSIGAGAFYGCDKIEKIYFYSKNTEIVGFLKPYSDIIIFGYRNSTAEAYARENGLVFDELIGD